jgi:hypothetical protein
MYYMMECDEPLTESGAALMDIRNCFRAGTVRIWRGGRRFRPEEVVPKPIEIDFEPLRGYKGPPIEMLDVCIPIMSSRLAAALLQAGVDNIDFYPTVVTNTVTRERHDYQAFNVVGLLAAADLERSEWDTYDGVPVADVSFKGLAFDDSKAVGILAFRLAENINAFAVHDSVRDHVIESGINTLKFVAPEDWVHL